MALSTFVAVLTLALLVGVQAKPFDLEDSEIDFALLTALLERPQTVSNLGSWSWSDCSAGKDAIFANAVITPDPIVVPGYISAEVNVTLKNDITAPLKAVLSIKKKIAGLWIPIPCIDNIGSCTYDDVCSMIPIAPGDTCPDPLPQYKIPCTCPFKMGSYALPKTWFNIPGMLSKFNNLGDGDYEINAKVSIKDVEVGCYDVTASLKLD